MENAHLKAVREAANFAQLTCGFVSRKAPHETFPAFCHLRLMRSYQLNRLIVSVTGPQTVMSTSHVHPGDIAKDVQPLLDAWVRSTEFELDLFSLNTAGTIHQFVLNGRPSAHETMDMRAKLAAILPLKEI